MLDPATGPRLILDMLWQEVATWQSIGGIWFQARQGHLTPSGTFLVGNAIAAVDEIAPMAGPTTAPINTDDLPVVARQIRDGNVPVATLLVSHHDSEDAAAFLVDAISRWCMDRLRLQLEVSELSEENHALRESLTPQVREHEILTVSGAMNTLIQTAVRAAASTATMLIQGETGTGKELLARLIHSHSHRAHKPMVTVNAGAFSPTLLESELFGHAKGSFTGADRDRKGVFEIADGGTLFLDEVGEISPEVQVRLLRVLQERCINRVGDHRSIPVDVRIVAATHRDLTREVETGRFREDLFYRLNVVNLMVPPLRKRHEDIPLLINHFLQRFNRANFKNVEEVPRSVLEMLCRYPWPGNIRELENCVQKAVVLAPGGVFTEELVPTTIRSYANETPAESGQSAPVPLGLRGPHEPDADFQAAIERYADARSPDIGQLVVKAEKILIHWALNKERGVKLRAAKALGINRVTLDRKLVEYDLHVKRGQGIIDEVAAGP